MLDLNLIKTEIKRPITRYMIILYLITLFSQLIYFRENSILPSTAKYDFFLILNHLKEISIAIMAYFFSVIIFQIFRSFTYYTNITPYFYWGDFIGIIAYLCFFYYLGTYYPINDYLKNWDIIFLCIFLNLMIETSQYISKIDKYKDRYLEYEKKIAIYPEKDKFYSKDYRNLCKKKINMMI